jgi:hypothetical protein
MVGPRDAPPAPPERAPAWVQQEAGAPDSEHDTSVLGQEGDRESSVGDRDRES